MRHPTLITVLVSAAVGAMSAVAVVAVDRHSRPAPVVQAAKTPTNMLATRSARQWPEITQDQVDAFTKALEWVPRDKRSPVVIFCQNEVLCGDLALNLENALESAHWTVTRETPLADATNGIGVSDIALRAMLASTTGLSPVAVEANLGGGKIAIVVGRQIADKK